MYLRVKNILNRNRYHTSLGAGKKLQQAKMEISKMFMAHIVVFLEIYCTCNSIKVINIHRRYVEYINEVSEWRRVWKCRLKKKKQKRKKSELDVKYE
jgi:hypothetical protein